MRALLWGAGVVLITLLGFSLFPGHTYLQSDTQIYIPMLERLNNPALFSRDIVALRPHLAFTIYDDTAVALKRISHLDFQILLTAEQLLFRALAVWGLILIALRLGLTAAQSFFVAAIVSLGATIGGPAVLTIEYEPVPRGFAISLIVFALGLVAEKRFFGGGAAAGAGVSLPPSDDASVLGNRPVAGDVEAGALDYPGASRSRLLPRWRFSRESSRRALRLHPFSDASIHFRKTSSTCARLTASSPPGRFTNGLTSPRRPPSRRWRSGD